MNLGFLQERWPLLVFSAASAALACGFLMRFGGERGRARTVYRPMAGFTGDFEASTSSGASAVGPNGPVESREALGLMSQAVQGAYPPVQATEVLRSIASLVRSPSHAHKKKRRVARAGKAKKALPKEVALAKAKAPKSQPTLPTPAKDTWDSVSDQFDADPAAYPLNEEAAKGGVSLRLVGLSRQKTRCILKARISNQGADDFFVKSLSVVDGRADLEPESFVRLFVESGRSRDAFVVFDAPPTGVEIHAVLKEDKEKGRTISLAVPYPF